MHSELKPGKVQYSTQKILTGCFLYERIETQNLGKDQTLPAVVALGGTY